MESLAEQNLIYSTFAKDPDLAGIVETFVDEMPTRVASILNCIESEDWEGLRRASREIRGAASSFGFTRLAPYAGGVESAVLEARPEEEVRAAVEQLLAMCRSIRPGIPV